MIERIFDESILGDYSRPGSSDIYFKAFKAVGTDVFGQGSTQLVTNAGTSMLTNTTGTIPEMLQLFDSHIKIDSLAIRYTMDEFDYKKKVDLDNLSEFLDNISLSDFINSKLPNLLSEPLYIDIRDIYVRYKEDLDYRKEVNKIMFRDMETLTLNTNLPLAFVFIIYAIHTFKKNNFLTNNRDRNYSTAIKYFKNQEELIKKYSEVLQTSENLFDLTDCCAGQYRFVDYQLSEITDVKALPLVLVHLLIDNSSFLKNYLIGKIDKVRTNRK